MFNVDTEQDNEDQLMQVDSDGSDEHHSPQMYVSSNKETSFSKQYGAYKNSRINQIERKPGLSHSSSNNRLRYKMDIRSTPINYIKDKSASSTSNITTHYQRSKPIASIDLQPSSSSLNKTSYGYSHRSKPLSNTLSYNARPVVGRRYEPQLSKIVDTK